MTPRIRALCVAFIACALLLSGLPAAGESSGLVALELSSVPMVGASTAASTLKLAEVTATPVPSSTPVPTPVPTITPVPTPLTDALSASASASPDGLVRAGNVEVSIRLANGGGATAEDVYILSETGDVLAGPLALRAGDSQTYRHELAVSDAQLAAGRVQYGISYVLGKGTPLERAVEKDVSAEIKKLEAQPELEFTRELSTNYVEYGGELTVTYRLKNTGNVKLTGIVVSDPLFGGTVEQIESLSVGKKKTITRKLTVTERMVSKATASYRYEGSSAEKRVTRGSSTIYLANVKLDLVLETDKANVAPGELVTLRLKLINNGNVSFSKLRVEDDMFGDLGSVAGEIKPGQSYTITKSIQLKSTTTFQFGVTGTCATGSEVSLQSNELTVFVTPVASEIKLKIQAQADRTRLDGPGEVTFTLQVINDGGLELRNVLLSEETRGKIRSLLFVPLGEMPALTQPYEVTESGTFRFMAQTTDSAGETLIVFSDPIEIEVLQPDPLPTPGPAPAATTRPWAYGQLNRFLPVIAIASGLMVALIALLIISWVRTHREKKRKKKTTRRKRDKS